MGLDEYNLFLLKEDIQKVKKTFEPHEVRDEM